MNELLLRRRSAIISNIPALPYDAEIEYLESTGTQYINTGIHNLSLGSTYHYTLEACFTSRPTTRYYGSGYTTGTEQFFVALHSGVNALYCCFAANTNNTIAANISQDMTSWHKYDIIKDSTGTHYYLDDVEIKTHSRNLTVLKYFTLFALSENNDNVNADSFMKIRKCSLSVDNVDKFDYISVRVGKTGYMYDKVSGNLFGNIGTGSFVLGNDVN